MENTIPGRNGGRLKPGDHGQSNRGRPKGSLSAKTIIRKWLEAKENFKNPITQKEQKLTQYDIITLGQLQKARKGDTAAFNALLDRTEGKPTQYMGNDAESPLLPPVKLNKEQIDKLIDKF